MTHIGNHDEYVIQADRIEELEQQVADLLAALEEAQGALQSANVQLAVVAGPQSGMLEQGRQRALRLIKESLDTIRTLAAAHQGEGTP